MRSINNIFKEEIEKLLKNPRNIIIVLIAPLVLTLLIGGVYYNDYLKDIPIAILDQDNTSTSRMITNEFENNERFYTSRYVNSLEELKESIDKKEAFLGVYIPKDFSSDIKKQKSSKVGVFIDESNISIGNTAYAPAMEILGTLNAGVDIKVFEAKGINPTTSYQMAKIFNFESRILYDPKLTYKGYVMPGMIIVFVQQMFLSAFIPLIINDRKNILAKAIIYSIMGAISYLICAIVLKNFLNIRYDGHLLIPTIYMWAFLMALVGPAMVIAYVFKSVLRVTQFTMLLSMPTFLTAGYAWPVEQFPPILLYMVKLTWPLIYVVSPIRDMVIKDTPIWVFKENIIGLLIFGIFWYFFGSKLIKPRDIKGETYEKDKERVA